MSGEGMLAAGSAASAPAAKAPTVTRCPFCGGRELSEARGGFVEQGDVVPGKDYYENEFHISGLKCEAGGCGETFYVQA